VLPIHSENIAASQESKETSPPEKVMAEVSNAIQIAPKKEKIAIITKKKLRK
jgi:hypothetical protein